MTTVKLGPNAEMSVDDASRLLAEPSKALPKPRAAKLKLNFSPAAKAAALALTTPTAQEAP